MPIPPIYPVGKPITGTNAFTPTFAFIDNSATIKLDKKLYSLQVNSTLQLTLPGNEQNIPAELKIDATGKLDGKINEIELNIAGQRLTMKEVKVTNSSLIGQRSHLDDQPRCQSSRSATHQRRHIKDGRQPQSRKPKPRSPSSSKM